MVEIAKFWSVVESSRTQHPEKLWLQHLRMELQKEHITLDLFEEQEITHLLNNLGVGIVEFWNYFYTESKKLSEQAQHHIIDHVLIKNNQLFTTCDQTFHSMLVFFLKNLIINKRLNARHIDNGSGRTMQNANV